MTRRTLQPARACALALTAMAGSLSITAAAADYTTLVDPDAVLADRFEGWGTSLAWWANVVGGLPNRQAYAELLFDGLEINIFRYNIGGGEDPARPDLPTDYRARMPGFQPLPGIWDWRADGNQRWILREGVARGVDTIEAFANSPPYWMTVSGSVTGSGDGASDNLQQGMENAFARYLNEVSRAISAMDGVTLYTVTPMNEPNADWWSFGGRQEGCHMSRAQQDRMLVWLRASGNTRGMRPRLNAAEAYSQSETTASINAYPAGTIDHLAHISTHTYSANNAVGLRTLALAVNRPAWVSEYGDGDASGLEMARRIQQDLTVMRARAWIYWQLVDNAGGWGMLRNSLNGRDTGYTVNQKYYVFAQFSRFLRPGFGIIDSGDDNTVAAYDAAGRRLVLITVNDTGAPFAITFDLSRFAATGTVATRYRTASGEQVSSIGDVAIVNRQFLSAIKEYSVTTHVVDGVTIATSVPATPANLRLASEAGSLALAWDPVPGAITYHLERSTQSEGPFRTRGTGLPQPRFTDTGVLPGTRYFYRVAAVNLAGQGAFAGAMTHPIELDIPSPPRGLAAVEGLAGIGLWWNPVRGASGYTVLRAASPGGPYVPVGTVIESTHFTDSTVSGGATAYYAVSAYNEIGVSEHSGETGATVAEAVAVTEDAQVRAGTYANANYGFLGISEVKLDNNNPSDTRELYLQLDVAGLDEVSSARLRLVPVSVGSDANTTTHEVEEVNDDGWSEQTLTWATRPAGSGNTLPAVSHFRSGQVVEFDLTDWVRAEAAGDDVLSLRIRSTTSGGGRWVLYGCSENSAPDVRPTLLITRRPPAAPGGLSATTSSAGMVLSWVPVEGASGYILSRGNRPEGAVTAIAGNLVTSTFTDSSVTDGLTYTYQVQAFSPGGVSPHSAASVAEAGLAAHYPLEGAGLDDSHGDLGGATSGADYPPVGVRGGGARFDGIDDYLQLPPSIHQDFTIACWVKTTDTGDGGQWWAGKGLVDAEVSGSTSDFGLALVGDTAAFGAGNPDTTLTASTPINDDRWHHVAATRDDASGEMQIYIDGALEGVTFGPTGPRNAPPSLRLGSIQTGTGFFAGAMDDIRLYRYRLDAAAVATLASSPNGPLRFLTADAIGPAFLATGTGGIPGHSYILRSTSTPAAPLPTWIPVQTNLFGANGSFTLTNVTNQGNLPRFYRIDQ